MRFFYLLFLLLALPTMLLATHNRAGEIIVRSDGDCSDINNQLSACATIITYTETVQTDVDREELILRWGDGTSDTIRRSREIFNIVDGIKRNEYEACHQYPGFGRYFLSFQDQNRVANIVNIDGGGSVNIPFSVYTVYTLTNPLLNGCNSSPQLTQVPIENACIGSVWTHNPGAFDVDGDSLAFEFTVPQRAPRAPIANYVRPGLGNSSLTINETTGQITWDAPAISGEYTLAFLVKSFRNGIPLDTLVRDMQIFVAECANDPPVIELPNEVICVTAGEVIEFDVIATAPITDSDQRVRLTASGRPFDIESNSATFTPGPDAWLVDPVRKTFRWATTCEHISNQPYFVVFRAEDDFFDPMSGLSTVRVVSIKVVAPPPENLQTVVDDEFITLSWDKPYRCEDTPSPRFLGFTVWRKEGSNPFPVDTCTTGLSGKGYTQITPTETMEMADGRFVYIDDDIERGKTYCYRVLALLGRPIANLPLIFEEIESIPSEEICVQLARDIPLLTKVDIETTGASDGVIDICWIRPAALALDTVLNTGPYRYVLSRADGQTTAPADFTEITSFTRQFFGAPVDTCFTDSNLDTEGQAYSYRIELFVDNESDPVGEAQPGSSVRIAGAPTDNAAVLSWTSLTPWTNVSYDLFRQDPGGSFTLLTTTAETSFRDQNLINGEEYCYYVLASGTYSVNDIPSPLLNRSQQICLQPLDNVPPCPPELSVISVCDRGVDCTITDNLFNTLNWVAPVDVCGDEDVAGYRLYFSPNTGQPGVLIAEINSESILTFDHTPQGGITGCYTISAFDLNGNESDLSTEVCVTNCPIYDLPNAFTPNGDSQNDLFIPRGRCFVERVEFQIFNRWGQLVFETNDPAINWDGTNLNGDRLASGTYYYVGQVFEQRLDGVTLAPEPLSGFIELITGE
ncbi:gliding motility-associated C-terminal domain-containing protein [Neolewinella persica]|uniref:gliding motility-associated C-terminal domain-containing protein n=1 Tax=Neolewinella persica TaxID=70998 RepID=UPI00036E7555|nr:T9SS C-terminal target domain-containing protein [Neolewinella persica]